MNRTVRVVAMFVVVLGFIAHAAVTTAAVADPEVVFNTNSLIYHRASCSAARRCTKSCIVIKLSEAKKRGGRACKICGGPATQEDEVFVGSMPQFIVAKGRGSDVEMFTTQWVALSKDIRYPPHVDVSPVIRERAI